MGRWRRLLGALITLTVLAGVALSATITAAAQTLSASPSAQIVAVHVWPPVLGSGGGQAEMVIVVRNATWCYVPALQHPALPVTYDLSQVSCAGGELWYPIIVEPNRTGTAHTLPLTMVALGSNGSRATMPFTVTVGNTPATVSYSYSAPNEHPDTPNAPYVLLAETSLAVTSIAGTPLRSQSSPFVAQLASICLYSTGAVASCGVLPGTVSWGVPDYRQGGNVGNQAPQLLPGCASPVGGTTTRSHCTVPFRLLGDQQVQATYQTRPGDGSASTVTALTAVRLLAPVDLSAGMTYNSYQNGDVNDCMMAAAADWVQTTWQHTPNPTQIVQTYWDLDRESNRGQTLPAGGTPLSNVEIFQYWTAHGIAGTKLLTVTANKTPMSQTAAEALLNRHQALYTAVILPAGIVSATPEGHAWLVVGYSGYGPVVITWGAEVQISWAQFTRWTGDVWTLTTTSPRQTS
jgi:hypothetical protein